MEVVDADSTEWVTNIDSKDARWCLKVFMQCPGLSSQFPREVVAALDQGMGVSWGDEPYEESQQDWIDNPRLLLVKEGENDSFRKFEEWFESVSYSRDTWLNADGNHVSGELCLNEARRVIDSSEEIRALVTDEQMLRFLEEIWRVFVYGCISDDLERDIATWEKERPELEKLLQELQANRDDELKDFVWSEENRQEDRENAQRLRARQGL